MSFRSLISALLPTSHIEDPGVLGNGKRKTFISLAACMGWEIALRILSPYTTGSTWQSMNHHIKPLPCIGRQVISPNLSISQANCRYRSAEGLFRSGFSCYIFICSFVIRPLTTHPPEPSCLWRDHTDLTIKVFPTRLGHWEERSELSFCSISYYGLLHNWPWCLFSI